MAETGSALSKEEHIERERKLLLYVVAVVALFAVAAISSFFVPSGGGSATGLDRCNSIAFQSSKSTCISELAVSTHNSTLCGLLQGYYADQCYINLAENSSNPVLCSMIGDTDTADLCLLDLASSTGNARLCLGLSGGNSSQCAYEIAVAANDTAACSLVNGTAGEESCEATIYLNTAVRQNNTAVCSHILSNNDTNTTYSVLQNSTMGGYYGTESNATAIFEYLALSGQVVGARDMCYMGVAFKSGNISDCSYIEGENTSSACRSSLTQLPNSTTNKTSNSTSLMNWTSLIDMCNSAGNSTTQAMCRYGYMSLEAEQTGNVSICKSIPDQYSYNCYYYLASKFNDTSYCGYISNATYNNACVGDVSGLYPAVPSD